MSEYKETLEDEIRELQCLTAKFRGDQSTLNELEDDLENLISQYNKMHESAKSTWKADRGLESA